MHTYIFGHLDPELVTRLEVVLLFVALVIAVIVVMHHFHQLKLEIITFVIELMDRIPFGLEKAVQATIHAALSITLYTSVYNFHLPLRTTFSYESVFNLTNKEKLYWCHSLSSMCNKIIKQ